MNKWKALALFFSLLSFGALKEGYRVFTSHEPDITNNRSELMVTALVITTLFLLLTILFWRKAAKHKLY